MIYNVSVTDGFVPLLGPLPLQFCMIFTMLVSIDVPLDADSDLKNEHANSIYMLMLINHILIFIIQVFSHFAGDRTFQKWLPALNTFVLMLQLFTIIRISSDWIFNSRETVYYDASTWDKFYVWIYMEFAFFISYIISNVSFLIIRGVF